MTLTIDIPPELEIRLEQEAARKGVSTDEYARSLLEETLATSAHPVSEVSPGDAWSVLESMMGTVEGPSDWSSEIDHYLYGTPKRCEQLR